MPLWPFRRTAAPPTNRLRSDLDAWMAALEESLLERAWEWKNPTPRGGEWTAIENRVSGLLVSWNWRFDAVVFGGGAWVDAERMGDERNDLDRLRGVLRRHLTLKAGAVLRHDFGATATALANAVLVGELAAARGLADEIVAHHGG